MNPIRDIFNIKNSKKIANQSATTSMHVIWVFKFHMSFLVHDCILATTFVGCFLLLLVRCQK